MPNERIHRMQAEQNERLARGLVLLSPQLMDWGVTACFYAALHFYVATCCFLIQIFKIFTE